MICGLMDVVGIHDIVRQLGQDLPQYKQAAKQPYLDNPKTPPPLKHTPP